MKHKDVDLIDSIVWIDDIPVPVSGQIVFDDHACQQNRPDLIYLAEANDEQKT
jgi:hypothetical protein